MNKQEYMDQLSELLLDIPTEERIEAIRYYEDYFADAGVENEEKLLEQLESPDKIAKAIREDYFGKSNPQDGEYTEAGYRDPQFEKSYEIICKGEGVKDKERMNQNRQSYKSSNRTALIIILCILASPILLGVVGSAIGLIFGLVGGLIGIVFAVFGGSIALVGGAVGTVVVGVSRLQESPATGFIGIGAGFIMAAIGIILFVVMINIIHWLLPTIIRSAQTGYQKIVKKRGSKDENIY